MRVKKAPVTAAIRVLREHRVDYREYLFDYVEHGGASQGARALGLHPHQIVKTLVLEDERRQPLMVLMHGDREVSTKRLARQLGVKSVQLCDPALAGRHSGYQIGGTSPFGTRRPLPVYAERSIRALSPLYVNGGKRGFMLALAVDDLVRILNPVWVDVALTP